jgi:hypothetical protein
MLRKRSSQQAQADSAENGDMDRTGETGRDRDVHVPYRDSVLTRFLKPTLGGNCYTFLLATTRQAVLPFHAGMRGVLPYAT